MVAVVFLAVCRDDSDSHVLRGVSPSTLTLLGLTPPFTPGEGGGRGRKRDE